MTSKNDKLSAGQQPMTVKPKQFSKKSQMVGYAHQEPPVDMPRGFNGDLTNSGKVSPNR